jgi:hypothetical protein
MDTKTRPAGFVSRVPIHGKSGANLLPTLEFLAALRQRRTEIGNRIIRFHAGD